MIGIAKTGAPGVGSLMAPLMVLMVGDARLAAGWTLPTLSTADVFAVVYWRRHADAKKLFSLIPWTLAGMAAGTAALSLSEPILRGIVATGAWFFFVLNLIKFPIYAWYHLLSRASLTFNLMEVPLVLAGALTGRWLVRVMPQNVFESLVLVLTALCSIALFF